MTEIDPGTMSEGTRALLWVIGLLVTGGGGYLIGNTRKVQLEPNRVEVSPDAITQLRAELDAHICDCNKNHAAVELRLSSTEKDVAEIKGQLPHINQSLHRIEGKIDTLMGKVRI